MKLKASYVQTAVRLFQEGHACSQAIFATYSPLMNFNEELAIKIACPFAGGIAHLGDICGIVYGAILVLGLKHGRVNPDDNEARDKIHRLVKDFMKKFNDNHGSLKCRDLIQCEIDTPEKFTQAKEQGVFDSVCVVLVRNGASLLESMLDI